ncbi:MAG: flagellar basal body P-ring protein FlgI [Planctomycetota bacterium]
MHQPFRCPSPWSRSPRTRAVRSGATILQATALHSAGRLVLGALLLTTLAACSGDKRGRLRDVDPVLPYTTPVLRGTIGSECKLRRVFPTIVSGYGVVVGLDGTGGRTVPERVAASMERELGLRGIGRPGAFEGTLLEGRTPTDVLRDPDVAVVVVEAAVPLAAPEGMRFDVRVRALPGSDTTSLEGGTLWTTAMQAGPPAVVGGAQTRQVAVASGEVFTNPFATAEGSTGDLNPREGRVLGGGRMTDPLQLEILLGNPLHSRARAIAAAINERFPDGPRGPGTTAKGVSDAVVSVRPPLLFRDRFLDFVELIRHLPIDPRFPEERARQYTERLNNGASRPNELVWALRALGPPAQPFVRELYDHPETDTRLAGLTAGAYLNDPRAGLVLSEIAAEPGPLRDQAIELLGVVRGRPSIDQTLRTIVETEEELSLRIGAYEALAKRATRDRLAALVRLNTYDRATDEQLAELAERAFPVGMIQGIVREPLGDKFVLDVLPVGDPLIYVTQQGQPRIAILGEDATIERPSDALAFEGQLIVKADAGDDAVRVRYRDDFSGRVIQQSLGESLPELVEFLARDSTPDRPEPGLRMSYSEVVGAMFAVHADGATAAAFATENDRLLAQLLSAATGPAEPERAVDSLTDPDDEPTFDPDAFNPDAFDAGKERAPSAPSRYVVPIVREPDSSRSASR